MVLKKQTVWLLTMLSLMVVLSAYYLFNNEPTDMQHFSDDTNWMQSLGEMDIHTTYSDSDKDFFLSYRLEKETIRSKMIDEYEKMMNQDATAQAVAQYKAHIDRIYELADAELTLESLIRQEGFEEAVVIADLDKVNVVVKSEDALERKQVLSIIHLVREHLNVPGNQVKVSYR